MAKILELLDLFAVSPKWSRYCKIVCTGALGASPSKKPQRREQLKILYYYPTFWRLLALNLALSLRSIHLVEIVDSSANGYALWPLACPKRPLVIMECQV